jgi:SPP1 gp7 family putative phage head morphogenesis protein
MIQRYGDAWRRLRQNLRDLLDKIAEEERAGLYPTQSEIMMMARYRRMMDQYRAEMNALARYADQSAANQQMMALEDARQMSLEMAQRSLSASAQASLSQAPIMTSQFAVGALRDGSPLIDSLLKYAGQSADEVGKILMTGISTGTSSIVIARQMRDVSGGNLTHALTIARTETMRAYNTEALERYRAYGFNAWMWQADMSERTCCACIAMDGTIHPLDEEFFGTHPRCRCCSVPITDYSRPEERQTGLEWFDEQPDEVQERMLGPAKFAAWRDGEFKLSDLVGYRDDPKWGPSRYEKSLRDILEEKGKSGSWVRYDHLARIHSVRNPFREEIAKTKPEGSRIGDTMDIHLVRSQRSIARRTFNAIDRVHGDGELPRTRMETGTVPDNWDMEYNPMRNLITARSGRNSNFRLDTIHEVGHMLDYKIFGNGAGYGSASSGDLVEWRKAVRESEAYEKLKTAENGLLIGDQILHVEYLLEEHELFARSYAQYITLRSGDRMLINELQTRLNYDKIGPYSEQWDIPDFEKIAHSFDNLFRKKSWLR